MPRRWEIIQQGHRLDDLGTALARTFGGRKGVRTIIHSRWPVQHDGENRRIEKRTYDVESLAAATVC
jgi:hypothetical protein